MRSFRLMCAAACTISVVWLGARAVADEPIPPIAGIGPTGPLKVVHDGLKFGEGPAADAQGRLYFTDVRASRVYRANPGGQPQLIVENSQAINGLMFDRNGRLLGCQGRGGKIVAIDVRTGKLTTIADAYNGSRFIQPNDLVVDRHGGIYFTDPSIGGGSRYQDKEAVYYVAPDGKVTRLIDDLRFPNGIGLSPDESTLYVLPYLIPKLMAYRIESPGKIASPKQLYAMPPAPNGRRGGGDGLTVDTRGNLYLTAPRVRAICVIDPQGNELGRIPLPAIPTNCAFGGPDFKTLYITTAATLYALPMEAKGYCLAAQ